jgi:bacillithiol system protein YtxJ
MVWTDLERLSQIDDLISYSHNSAILIFKHSTRCNISSIAKTRLETKWNFDDSIVKPYYLDLLNHRDISNSLAEKFNVFHESPQIILLKNGECILDASHLDISIDEIKEALN